MIDFSIENTSPIIYKDIDLILQQIDMLFDTQPGDVLGDMDYGTQYDRYLYNLKVTNDALKSKIENDLLSIDLLDYKYNVDVYFLNGTEREIAIIDINLYKDNDKYNRTYKIS